MYLKTTSGHLVTLYRDPNGPGCLMLDGAAAILTPAEVAQITNWCGAILGLGDLVVEAPVPTYTKTR